MPHERNATKSMSRKRKELEKTTKNCTSHVQTKQTPIISSNSYLSAPMQTNKQKTSSNISATDLAVCQSGVTLPDRRQNVQV